MTAPAEPDDRAPTGAQPGQGRMAGRRAAARAASLDGAKASAGYHRSSAESAASRVPLTAVLERCGVLHDLRRSGRKLLGCCPLHHGTNRRQFVVNPKASTWYRFGNCHRGGGTLQFVAEKEGVSVPDAARLVAEWFALVPNPTQRRPLMASKPTHKVLAVTDRVSKDKKAKFFYTRIGAGWPIKNGAGLSLQLDAMPINGRLVVLEIGEDDGTTENGKAER